MDFAEDDAAITVAPARTRAVSNRTDLAKSCATDDRIFGCTAFAGEKLTYVCEKRADRWHVRAQAQFIPFIYLLATNVEGIGHEKLHIEDVHRSLQQYLKHLDSTTFKSQDECERSGEIEASLFRRHMDDWKKQSNLERHPELRHAAK